jgi:23S rRNA (cytidine1920-2'-O)/16S rRNA (cytidine1409-2'-O)-methyltransferase
VPNKQRLDTLLVARDLATSRDLAQRLIMAGEVRVEGQVVLQPGTLVASQAEITLADGPRFVSRGGEKLEAALQAFSVRVSERVCADVGASTGGFTDCLLQHGAARVYAIDVGKGILDWCLRQEPRVVVMEGTNARSLECLPEPVTLVTMDVSFISLKVLLPNVRGWLRDTAISDIIALVKPQFEASRAQVDQGKGVIRSPEIHRQVLLEVLSFAESEGYSLLGLIPSPLLGPKGNREFLTWLEYPTQITYARSKVTLEDLIQNSITA